MINASQAKAIATFINRATTERDGAALVADGAAYTITTRKARVSFTLADPSDSYAVQIKHPAGDCFGGWDADWQPLATWPAEALEYCARAMAENDVRFYLCGLALYPHGIAGCDGHRLHYIGHLASEAAAILPREAVALALRLQKKGPVVIETAGDRFRLRLSSGVTIAGHLVDGKYPDVPRVVPDIHKGDFQPVTVPAHRPRDLSKARDIVRTVSRKYGGMVLLDAGAYAENGDALPLAINLPEGRHIGINARYLIDALDAGEAATLHHADGQTAILVESGGRRAVVMPMRLDAVAGVREKIAAKATPTATASAPVADHHAGEDVEAPAPAPEYQEPPRMAAMADGTRPGDGVAVEWLPQDSGEAAETSAPQPAEDLAAAPETSEYPPAPEEIATERPAIQWPEGVTVPDRLSGPAKVAAIIKKELAAIGIKARAKSHSYSMGDSVRVTLEDVPSDIARAIEARYKRHQQGHFNGMEDIYEYTNSRSDIPQTKYLFVEREFTAPVKAAAWQWFRDNFRPEGIEDVPADIESREFQHARIWQDYAPAILWRVLTGAIDRDGRTFWDDYPGGNRPTPPRGGKPAPQPAQGRTPAPAPVPGIAAHVEAHHNTRKGFDYWLVVLADRVDRDTFAALLANAKAARGWYSRQWGDIPGGFAFKSQAAAEDFAASLNGGPSAPPPGQKPGAETSRPQPAQPAPASHPQPAPAGNPARAAKLRALAQGLQPAIDKAFAPRLDNTPKRAAQAAHARLEGHRLERTQKALNALADLAEAGTTPAPLAGITTKAAVYDLMAATTEPVANGWHSYRVDTGKPALDTEPARLLWGLLDDNGERHRQAELARKLAAVKLAGIPGYFPTPATVAAEILQRLDIAPGCVVLEPSAGSGNLCDAIKARQPGAQVLAYEVNHALRDILAAKGYTPAGGDFTEQPAAPVADFVVMNPPFEQLQDAEHVRHAFGFLKPGGRLVAIMSPAPFNNSTRKAQAFRDWFEAVGGTRHDLPAGAFKESGTGVATCYVVIDAPEDAATSPTPPAVAPSDAQPAQDSNAKAMKVYNWDAVALSNAYTNAQLVALMRQVEDQHRNPVDAQGHPLENGRSTLHLFDKAGRRKLDAIGWAIRHNLTEQTEAQAPAGAVLH